VVEVGEGVLVLRVLQLELLEEDAELVLGNAVLLDIVQSAEYRPDDVVQLVREGFPVHVRRLVPNRKEKNAFPMWILLLALLLVLVDELGCLDVSELGLLAGKVFLVV